MPADLKGKTIAVNRGTLEDTEVTKVAPEGADIQRYNDYNGVISAFLSGQAQLMVVGNDVGATILAQNPAIEPVQKFQLLTSPSHMGVKKGETRLQDKLNEVIAGMRKDGSLNELVAEVAEAAAARRLLNAFVGYQLDFSALAEHLILLLEGAGITLALTAIAATLGIALSIAGARDRAMGPAAGRAAWSWPTSNSSATRRSSSSCSSSSSACRASASG